MNLEQVLKDYQFPPEAIERILTSGVKELYPPQAETIKKGLLDGKSLLMSVPTAAGKTLIAELAMIRSILLNGGRCLYIVPLKALASEKFQDFKNRYEPLGINVGLAIGDLDSPSKYLNRYKIILATAEKVDSLLRSKAKWLIDALTVVVLDEIHFINDGSRGPTLEILTARIKQLNPTIQFLALSATVSNAKSMADWLGAELVVSNWRPIPLKEGVYFNEKIVFDGHGVKMINEDPPDDLSKLTLDTLRGKGQVLVFVNSRRSAQASSKQIAPSVLTTLTPEEKKELLALAREVASPASDATKICKKLAEVVSCGVAFHHAGLKPRQRELIETNFKKNLLKAICSTPTLAAGVNLPARRAIIRDLKRFESGIGAAYIPTSEYKQCAGRAGRPQYDDQGEAVMIAKSLSESQTLFERYIHASPEPVISKLGSEAALRIHVLSSIAGGYIFDTKGMFDFISHTFLYHQKLTPNILDLISQIFDFLHREKFIEKSGYRYFPTVFGNLTSRLYIDPLTAMTLRDGLQVMAKRRSFSAIGMLHLITMCPDNPILNVGKTDMEDLDRFAHEHHDEFFFTPENREVLNDFFFYSATLKTTWMHSEWINETREDLICDQFNIGPGDVYRHVESVQWLLYGATTMADLLQFKNLTFPLEDLRQRMAYGIKEELLELVQLKGVGRIRARNLFDKGYKKLNDLKFITADQLSNVPQVGKSLAQEIVDQVLKLSNKPSLNTKAVTAGNTDEDGWDN